MFQQSKAHFQTPLLSLHINPVVQNPPSPPSVLCSTANSLSSLCPALPSFVFHYECPGNHQPQVWQKYIKRAGDEPRMAGWGWKVAWGCVRVHPAVWSVLADSHQLNPHPVILFSLSTPLSFSFTPVFHLLFFLCNSVFICNAVCCFLFFLCSLCSPF